VQRLREVAVGHVVVLRELGPHFCHVHGLPPQP